jgi:hypothetical protein
MMILFNELKSYFKNILVKYYKLSLLEKEYFIIEKNILYLKNIKESIYFNKNIAIKKIKKNKLNNQTPIIENTNKQIKEKINKEIFLKKNIDQVKKIFNETDIEPINEHVNKPVYEQVIKSVYEPIKEHVNKPIKKSDNKQVIKSVNEPIKEHVNKPIKKSDNEQVIKSVNKPINEHVNKPINEPVNKPIIEFNIEPVNKPVIEKIIEPVIETVIKLDTEKKNTNPGINKYKENYNNLNIDIKNNPELSKILNFYYNVNDINVKFNNNNNLIINHKNTNLIEYFYYNKDIKFNEEKYYSILYNNNNKHEIFNILIQVGNYDTLKKMSSYIKNFNDINVNIYYTIIEDQCSDNNINYIKNLTPRCTILKTKNKGMDIGLFIINLLYFRDNNINPKYILKLHTKTDDDFRNNVLRKLCNNKEQIINNLVSFKNNKKIGMIKGTSLFKYNKNKNDFINHIDYLYYLNNYIYDKEFEFQNLEFITGTFFYANFDIFNVLDSINLKFLYYKLNDLNTLDTNWYKLFYNLNNLNNNEIKNHYKNNKSNFGNNLIMQSKTKCLGMRDFMFEHALERFFGYMCKYNDLIII